MNQVSKQCGRVVRCIHQKVSQPCLAVPSYALNTTPISSNKNYCVETIGKRGFSAVSMTPVMDRSPHQTTVKSTSTIQTPQHLPDKYAIRDDIKFKIRTWKKGSGDSLLVLKALQDAQTNQIDLESRDYLIGLSVCVDSRGCDKKLPFWIFDKLKTVDKVVSIEGFEKILRFCQNRRLVDEAVEIIELYRSTGYQLTETIFTTVISILVKGPLHKNNLRLIQSYYDSYREMNKTLGWRLTAQLYCDIAVAFCKNKQGGLSLNVLEDMTKAHHEPNPQLCEELLEAALFYKETKVLRVLASWYSNHFNVRLEYGALNRMLQVAASVGDGQLAIVSFQMFAKNGYHLSKSNYLSLIRALLKSDDLISAVEALQELESNGIQMTLEEYRSMKQAIVTNLTVPTQQTKAQKNNRLDDLYYALVDQKETGGQIVPIVVLDAILESAGKLESVDRAFATFQDYQKIFQIHPTTETYNSLLLSASWHREIQASSLLSILQAMDSRAAEGLNCAPNSLSYSILLETLIAKREKTMLQNVIQHMDALSIFPIGRASRRLLSYLRKNQVQNIPSGFMEKLQAQTLVL